MLAAAGGYALFWAAMLQFPKRGQRFLCAFLWYASVQAVHLSWMTSTHYMGPLILGVYAFLLIGLGIQFGLFSWFLNPKEPLSQTKCLGLAGFWVLMEWMRIFFLTGFTWNPVGLALADCRFSIQLAALFGIYGLSFWAIWTNLAGLNAFFLDQSSKTLKIWLFLALFPYGFGLAHQAWVERKFGGEGKKINVALVDTGLSMEQKYRDRAHPESFIPVLHQWERVWDALGDGHFDLIVLPEGAFPYGMHHPFCSLKQVQARWDERYGKGAHADFPPLEASFSGKVGNAFLAQSLANHYRSEVILGLDVEDRESRYNAAFQFHPGQRDPERYDKRILVPVGEYVAFKKIRWIADFLAKEFGIEDSFDAGTRSKIFPSPLPIGVAICLEEIYSGLVRQLRKEGAELFVSLSNDVWFPSSRLPRQHFDHGRIRAVENGVFLLRSSNMGVTGGVDCFGQPIGALSLSGKKTEAIVISIPIFSYPTLYSFLGNEAIISLSSCCFLLFLGQLFRRKSCP